MYVCFILYKYANAFITIIISHSFWESQKANLGKYIFYHVTIRLLSLYAQMIYAVKQERRDESQFRYRVESDVYQEIQIYDISHVNEM